MWGGFVFARWRACLFAKRSQLMANGVASAKKDIGMRIAVAWWLQDARELEVIEPCAEET
jgi:hypothetical protein